MLAEQYSNPFWMSHLNDHKWIKTTKKTRKGINYSFLPDHIGFYGMVQISTAFFSNIILAASWYKK